MEKFNDILHDFGQGYKATGQTKINACCVNRCYLQRCVWENSSLFPLATGDHWDFDTSMVQLYEKNLLLFSKGKENR